MLNFAPMSDDIFQLDFVMSVLIQEFVCQLSSIFFFQNDKPNKLRRICYARIIITIDLIECFNNKKTVWDEIKSTSQSDNFHAR